ncbi:MAG: hypothetical protein GY869_07665 [Planctomycetes bacterium]|nr:hypothetical protein [Planctomycetota bacterium]
MIIEIEILSEEQIAEIDVDEGFYVLRGIEKKYKKEGLRNGYDVKKLKGEYKDEIRLFIIRIIFWNNNDEILNFKFDNAEFDVEGLNLKVYTKDGKEVEFEDTLHVCVSGKPARHILAPGESYSYDLEAEIEDGKLKFSGGNYQFIPGNVYEMEFHYLGCVSNRVKWEYPSD